MSNIDTSNIVPILVDTSNIPTEIKEKCCISNENCILKNTIQLQTAEIGRMIEERNVYKKLYEDLLNLIYANTSNI